MPRVVDTDSALQQVLRQLLHLNRKHKRSHHKVRMKGVKTKSGMHPDLCT